jgi:hypothetical protein
MPFSLRGTVRSPDGSPIAGASVRLFGSTDPLGDVPRAAISREGSVSWTRTITGYAGRSWNAWQKYVMNHVAGITYEEFKVGVQHHNPHLQHDGGLFKQDESYLFPQQIGTRSPVRWTRTLTGFAGSSWDCWVAHVQGKVQGITREAFEEELQEHNPHLVQDGGAFVAHKSYRLPENVPDPDEITWTRPLLGYGGYAWGCWEKYVRDQVSGLTWGDFRRDVARFNPHLAKDRGRFWANKTYVLPENPVRPRYYLFATTSKTGRFSFDGLTTPGNYEMITEYPGYHPRHQQFALHGSLDAKIKLYHVTPTMVSLWPEYASVPPKVKSLIDQALAMLGDDQVVYDSLKEQVQPLATGYWHRDPNHIWYKDIVCADLVTICLHMAGVTYEWPVTDPTGRGFVTHHAANYYRPSPENPWLRQMAEHEPWLPGDILIYWRGDLNASTVGHVNLYIGPFGGVDISGNEHAPEDRYDVVNASIDHEPDESDLELGTTITSMTKADCWAFKCGYEHVMRLRHVQLWA